MWIEISLYLLDWYMASDQRGIFIFTSEFFNSKVSKEVFDAKSKNKIKKINWVYKLEGFLYYLYRNLIN